MIIQRPPPVDFGKDRIFCLSNGDSRESAIQKVIQRRLDQVKCPKRSRRLLASEFRMPRPSVRNPLPKSPEFKVAAKKIHDAIREKKRIVLFGDYDCDGVTSITLLHDFLRAAGVTEHELNCFIPDRAKHGYGLTKAALQNCVKGYHPELMIVLDCGTNSYEQIDWLNEEGIDSVVVDHHLPGGHALNTVLINPKAWSSLPDRHWDLRLLSAAGLSFLLVQGLAKKFDVADWDESRAMLLAGLGTYVDMVPLVGINRALVKHSLHLAKSGKLGLVPGLDSLETIRQRNKFTAGPLPEQTYGFFLGPCLNAPGRLGDAKRALRLLLAQEISTAKRLARKCFNINESRKRIQRNISKKALELAECQDSSNVILLAGEGWHGGVIGIVASDVKEAHHRPVIVCTWHEGDEEREGFWKGSGRSIEAFNMGEAIQKAVADGLIRNGGGHEMAGGLSFTEGQRDEFFKWLNESCGLDKGHFVRRTEIVARAEWFNPEDWHIIYRALEPFGSYNPEPSLIAEDVELSKPPEILSTKRPRIPVRGKKQATKTEAPQSGNGEWGAAGVFTRDGLFARIETTELDLAKKWKVGDRFNFNLMLTAWTMLRTGKTIFGFRARPLKAASEECAAPTD